MNTNTYTNSSERCFVSISKTMIALMFLVFIGTQVSAQNAPASKNLTGTVRFSEDNDVAPGVNIYLKGSTAQGTYSDAKGNFEFPSNLKAGDILVFSFIGRKTLEYVVADPTASAIEIIMGPDSIQMVEDVLVEGEDSERPSFLARVIRRSR